MSFALRALPIEADSLDLDPVLWLARRIGRPIIALDTESTTFVDVEGFGIAEVAIVIVPPAGSPCCASTLLDPGVRMQPGATRVSGLTDAHLRGRPLFPSLHDDLGFYLARSQAIVTGYRVDAFDLRGVARDCARYNLPIIEATEVRDLAPAIEYYQRANPESAAGLANKRLTSVAAHLGISLPGDPHRALFDALLSLGILSYFVARYGYEPFLGGYVLPQRSDRRSPTASTLAQDRERLRCAAEAAVALRRSSAATDLSHDEVADALQAAGFATVRHGGDAFAPFGVTVIDANGLRARIDGRRYDAMRTK